MDAGLALQTAAASGSLAILSVRLGALAAQINVDVVRNLTMTFLMIGSVLWGFLTGVYMLSFALLTIVSYTAYYYNYLSYPERQTLFGRLPFFPFDYSNAIATIITVLGSGLIFLFIIGGLIAPFTYIRYEDETRQMLDYIACQTVKPTNAFFDLYTSVTDFYHTYVRTVNLYLGYVYKAARPFFDVALEHLFSFIGIVIRLIVSVSRGEFAIFSSCISGRFTDPFCSSDQCAYKQLICWALNVLTDIEDKIIVPLVQPILGTSVTNTLVDGINAFLDFVRLTIDTFVWVVLPSSVQPCVEDTSKLYAPRTTCRLCFPNPVYCPVTRRVCFFNWLIQSIFSGFSDLRNLFYDLIRMIPGLGPSFATLLEKFFSVMSDIIEAVEKLASTISAALGFALRPIQRAIALLQSAIAPIQQQIDAIWGNLRRIFGFLSRLFFAPLAAGRALLATSSSGSSSSTSALPSGFSAQIKWIRETYGLSQLEAEEFLPVVRLAQGVMVKPVCGLSPQCAEMLNAEGGIPQSFIDDVIKHEGAIPTAQVLASPSHRCMLSFLFAQGLCPKEAVTPEDIWGKLIPGSSPFHSEHSCTQVLTEDIFAHLWGETLRDKAINDTSLFGLAWHAMMVDRWWITDFLPCAIESAEGERARLLTPAMTYEAQTRAVDDEWQRNPDEHRERHRALARLDEERQAHAETVALFPVADKVAAAHKYYKENLASYVHVATRSKHEVPIRDEMPTDYVMRSRKRAAAEAAARAAAAATAKAEAALNKAAVLEAEATAQIGLAEAVKARRAKVVNKPASGLSAAARRPLVYIGPRTYSLYDLLEWLAHQLYTALVMFCRFVLEVLQPYISKDAYEFVLFLVEELEQFDYVAVLARLRTFWGLTFIQQKKDEIICASPPFYSELDCPTCPYTLFCLARLQAPPELWEAPTNYNGIIPWGVPCLGANTTCLFGPEVPALPYAPLLQTPCPSGYRTCDTYGFIDPLSAFAFWMQWLSHRIDVPIYGWLTSGTFNDAAVLIIRGTAYQYYPLWWLTGTWDTAREFAQAKSMRRMPYVGEALYQFDDGSGLFAPTSEMFSCGAYHATTIIWAFVVVIGCVTFLLLNLAATVVTAATLLQAGTLALTGVDVVMNLRTAFRTVALQSTQTVEVIQ